MENNIIPDGVIYLNDSGTEISGIQFWGSPFGILDETVYGNRTGCEDLLLRVDRVKPKFHIFGHIHEEYGTFTKAETILSMLR